MHGRRKKSLVHIVCASSVPPEILGILKISLKSVRNTNCQNGLLLKHTPKCTVDYATMSMDTSTICLRSITVCVSPLPSLYSLHRSCNNLSRPSTTFSYCKQWKARYEQLRFCIQSGDLHTFVLSTTLLRRLLDHFRHWISYHIVTI